MSEVIRLLTGTSGTKDCVVIYVLSEDTVKAKKETLDRIVNECMWLINLAKEDELLAEKILADVTEYEGVTNDNYWDSVEENRREK